MFTMATSPNGDQLSRRPSHRSSRSDSPLDQGGAHGGTTDAGLPRPKRIACIICRKRKLKCDGMKPSCSTCSRLKHRCAYDEVRRKSGPKRGYVKELEARLAQVETQLKSKDRTTPAGPAGEVSFAGRSQVVAPGFQLNDLDMGLGMGDSDMMSGFLEAAEQSNRTTQSKMPSLDLKPDEPFSWEMIGLGLEEPLPPQDMIDELHQIYFEKIHPSTPMVHKYRYRAAMNLAPYQRPPICLRYAIWSMACSVVEKFSHFQEVFYQRARKYAEIDEMKGHGEAFITIGHAQCWTLIATYEFKSMFFPRAWQSVGRSARLVQMMGLHRLDGEVLEVKQTIQPPRDWTDKEERRRTFWAAYCADRYASIGTGWPMMIEEKDVTTHLPATDQAFEQSQAQETASLAEALSAEGSSSLSSYGAVVLISCLFGRNLTHLHRPDPNDRPEDPARGEFWKRHRALDSILVNISMFLPEHLRLPVGVKDPRIVFLNMSIHTSTICLHQAAILKAVKHNLGTEMIRQSTDRCFLAAGEIVAIMRLTSYNDGGSTNPFISFCLYVAARILIHTYKKRPHDAATKSNLDCLMTAMQAMRKKNPLAESFLVQLIVDIESSGLENPLANTKCAFGVKMDLSTLIQESSRCPPIMRKPPDEQPSYHELHEAVAADDGSLGIPSTEYAMNTFSVPTREQRNSARDFQQRFDETRAEMPPMHLNQGWADKFHDRTTMSPIANQFDRELVSDRTSDGQNSLSSHPTPPTSHHGSSNTSSYSPPNLDDLEHASSSRHGLDGSSSGGGGGGGPHHHPPPDAFFDAATTAPFAGFLPPPPPPPGNHPAYSTGAEGVVVVLSDADQFSLAPNWGLDAEATAGWSQMLETLGWDPNSTLATTGAQGPWRPVG